MPFRGMRANRKVIPASLELHIRPMSRILAYFLAER
jgi:hypothetical protein